MALRVRAAQSGTRVWGCTAQHVHLCTPCALLVFLEARAYELLQRSRGRGRRGGVELLHARQMMVICSPLIAGNSSTVELAHTAEPKLGAIAPIPPTPDYQNLLFSVARG